MTSYGQSVAPKFFSDSSAKQFTKMQFLCYLHKALLTVGMKAIRSLMPVGVPDPALVSDIPVSGSRDDLYWLYDFPTTETFTINNILYRPCLAVVAQTLAGYTSVTNYNGEMLTVVLCARRADRVVFSDIINYSYYLRNAAQRGFGTSGTAAIGSFAEGTFIALAPWRWCTTFIDAYHIQLLSVKNVEVVMTKAGLLIQVGTGTTKTDNNNLLNCLVCFGGARIPGLGRIPAQDLNLNRINPTLMLAFNAGYNSPYPYLQGGITLTGLSMTGLRLTSQILGMQHDLNYTLDPVLAQCFNLENIQRPLFPLCGSDTKTSPRMVNSQGANVLNRMAYVSWNDSVTPSVYYGPKDSSLRVEPVPTWADVWTAEGFRYGDRTTPKGDFTDPTSGILWHLFLCPVIPMMCAVNIQGVTRYPAFALPTISQTPYVMDFTSAGWASALPFGATATHTDGRWVATTGSNTVTADAYQASASSIFDLTIPVGAIDPNVSYDLTFDYYNYTSLVGGFVAGYNPLYVQVSVDGGSTWTILMGVNMLNSTTVGYNVLAPAALASIPQNADGTIRLRFFALVNYAYGGVFHAAFRNITINKNIGS